MSTTIESYLIYGLRFGEEFTKNYWEQDFYDELEWNNNKSNDEPFFITDGMNGNYTFFGLITELSNGFDEAEEKELIINYNKSIIITRINELFPNIQIGEDDIKLYYLPHWT